MRDIDAELRDLDARSLLRRRRILHGPQGARVQVDGREFLSFCSNDYLGRAADERLVAALVDGARRYGVGAGASHLACGHHRLHETLERRLAAFVRRPRALLFGSGYCANLGVVSVLASARAEVFADRLNHASLNDGMLLARARFRRYPHLDADALQRLLRRSKSAERIVVTDSVFSMDGDLAPLPAVAALCERHGAWLIVDDAHGFGMLAPEGRGALAHFGVDGERVVYVGTLGKAAGVSGAFVAARHGVIELLLQRARTYMYTTAVAPALAQALLASLDIIEREQWRRDWLAMLGECFKSGLAGSRWRLLPSDSAIQAVVVGEAGTALALSQRLEQRSILAPAIRPPTVAVGTARLRISLCAAHAPEDVDRLTGVLRECERIAA
ncbi:MAG TPA: 8-amino-7-oxononanoate synthase [Burkholderiales bacterium]|nr:8-amino-7-oxononanoate synthase [Burkholderiales bacterium]